MTDYSNTARAQAPIPEADDPLAELARIVSGESDRQFKPSRIAQPVAALERQVLAPTAAAKPIPSFDLEDALMAELGMGAANKALPTAAEPEPTIQGKTASQIAQEFETELALATAPTPASAPEPVQALSLEDQLLAELGLLDTPYPVEPAPVHTASLQNAVEEPAQYSDDDLEAFLLQEAPSHVEPDYAAEDLEAEFSDELFGAPAQWPQEQPSHEATLPVNAPDYEEIGEVDLDLGAAFAAEIARNTPVVEPVEAPEVAVAPTRAPVDVPMPIARSLATPVIPVDARSAPRRPELTERELDDQFAAAFAEELHIGLSEIDEFDEIFSAAPASDTSAVAQTGWSDDEFADFEDHFGTPPSAPTKAQAPIAPKPVAQARQAPVQQAAPAHAPMDLGDPTEWDMAYGDEEYADSDPMEEIDARQPNQLLKSRGFTLAAVALACALVIGGGALAFGYMSGPQVASSEPPVVKADTNPVKIKPENPGGIQIANQDQAAYDKVAGQPKDGEAQASLVSQTEKPVDMAALTEPQPEAPAGEAKAEERLAPSEEGNAPAIPALAPRKVKTMLIKPDGTVVPAEETPVETVAAVDSNVTALVPVQPDARDVAGEALIPIDAEDTSANTGSTRSLGGAEAAPIDAAPQEIAQAPALAEPVPAKQEAPTQVSAEQPAASLSGEWAVQLASQRSAEDAQSTFQNLKRKFPSVLDGKALAVQRAEVSGKGVFYRVRVPTKSKEEAAELCERLKAAGGSCFIAR